MVLRDAIDDIVKFSSDFQGNIVRFFIMLLAIGVGVVLSGCEKTDFEKKAEADAKARQALNLKNAGN